MRNRSKQLNIRLTPQEASTLARSSRTAGLSQSSYVRMLINGYCPKPVATTEHHALIQSLTDIHSSLQRTGHMTQASQLQSAILSLQEALTAPRYIHESE